MIARIWHGWTTPEQADTYEQLLKTEIFPGIASRKTQGYKGIQLLRRSYKMETEFITVMLFESQEAVKRFAGEDYENAYVPPKAREVLLLYHHYDPQKDCAWVCEHDRAIIGSLFLQHKEEVAQLRYFLIHPKYRGIGLGKKLMELYMNFLMKCGYRSSFLWTTHELHAASSLYKKHGFVLTEEIPSIRFGKPLNEQKYEKSL